jgi:hypothetical protein
MAATPLPSTGDAPVAKTCDASGMLEIHRAFRAGFGEAPRLVGGVAPGDVTHAETVATQLHMLSAGLHSHHEGEDQRLWGPLADRAPSCAPHVERMKAQHAELLVHLSAMDAALPAWRAAATAPEAVLTALDGVNAALEVHLPDEERNIVPVMETVITEPEAAWFGEHGRKATPKGQTWNMLGTILSSQPDGGGEWLHKNLPAPVRLIWRLVGAPKYAKTRAALEGRRAA